VERHITPALAQKALLIGESYSSERVFAVSMEAVGWGIQPGMPLRQALNLYPQAHTVPARLNQYQRSADELVSVLSSFTDLVELEQIHLSLISYLDLGRLANSDRAKLAKELGQTIRAQTGLNPALGLTSGKFTAQLAANLVKPGRASIITPGREATFLAPLSMHLLPLDKPIATRLEQLGLSTIGQIAALPLGATLAQFGQRGRWLHELAQGHDARPVRRYRPSIEEQITRQFEDPISDRTILQTNSRVIASELVDRLHVSNQVGRRLRLCLDLEDGGAWVEERTLSQPTGDAALLSRLLDSFLGKVQICCAVNSMTVTLAELTPVLGRQLDLFNHQTNQENRLNDVLPDLIARYGQERFYQPSLTNSAAYLPEQRFQLVDWL
jgi:nucleotidyltransferase/DNA polymerase involved in DNA repair